MTKLILAGGGDENDSKPLDEFLASLIPKDKKLLYIPIAWKEGQELDGCTVWLKETFGKIGFSDIETITNLENTSIDDFDEIGAIYIGGGNTFYLLDQLRRTGFDKVLMQFVASGRPVYGGSAGAIIWGRDISTAGFGEDSDPNNVGLENLSGLNLVNNFVIQCHYFPDQDKELMEFVLKTEFSVIAIPEKSGVIVNGTELKVAGKDSSYVFDKEGKKEYKIDDIIV